MTPTHKDLRMNGVEVDHETGSTWNDCGPWSTWVYKLGDKFWRVHQPSDYDPAVKIDEVAQRKVVSVIYEPVDDTTF